MNLSRIFLLPNHRLRAGWRFLLFVVIFMVAVIISGLVIGFVLPDATESLAANATVLAGATLSTTWLMMRLVEQQPFAAVGLRISDHAASDLTRGLAAGAAMAGGAALIEWSAGLISFQSNGMGNSLEGAFLPATILLLVAATTEEILIRGYPFQRLIEGANGWVAVVVCSLIFGVLHASNPHSSMLGILNTVLAGVWLSLAYLRTQSLWLPIGLHFSWNWTLAVIGLPVSGLDLMDTPWRAVASSSHDWIHGGAYGPEGGAVGTLVLLLGIGFLLTLRPEASTEPKAASAPASAGDRL